MSRRIKASRAAPSATSLPIHIPWLWPCTPGLLDRESLVRIDSPANFTIEVRRLARSLWPKHKQVIAAYCLRHQWTTDMKRSLSADSISQGLGHASAKTRRHYGQANQASGRNALHPVAIEAVRPVKRTTAMPPSQQAESGNDAKPIEKPIDVSLYNAYATCKSTNQRTVTRNGSQDVRRTTCRPDPAPARPTCVR